MNKKIDKETLEDFAEKVNESQGMVSHHAESLGLTVPVATQIFFNLCVVGFEALGRQDIAEELRAVVNRHASVKLKGKEVLN